MSVGEMCVLIPNSAGRTYVEKFNQLRRRSDVPRCLFGPPDPEETERMFQEHMQYNRERMLKKYNVDILENGPQKGTQLLLVLMKHESKRFNELRNQEEEDKCETEVKPVPTESRIPSETVLESRLPSESPSSSSSEDSPSEDNFRPIHSHISTLKSKVENSSKLHRNHPYRQSQLTEFWCSRRHLSFDIPKKIPSSQPALPTPLLSLPRFEEERRRT